MPKETPEWHTYEPQEDDQPCGLTWGEVRALRQESYLAGHSVGEGKIRWRTLPKTRP